MIDSREIVLFVEDPKKSFAAIYKDPYLFGMRMRNVIGSTDEAFDRARRALSLDYGINVSSAKTVFRSDD